MNVVQTLDSQEKIDAEVDSSASLTFIHASENINIRGTNFRSTDLHIKAVVVSIRSSGSIFTNLHVPFS